MAEITLLLHPPKLQMAIPLLEESHFIYSLKSVTFCVSVSRAAFIQELWKKFFNQSLDIIP